MISVVVPIYNVEKYLDKCIRSILNQSYRNLEIILVDDGSQDNCWKICDSFAEVDSRIRVIHKENGGLSDARNIGIDNARGDYISFIDSDDFIHPQMFEVLLYNMNTTDADISVCDFQPTHEGDEIATTCLNIRMNEKILYEKPLIMEQLEYHNLKTVVAWNKLYKTKLFQCIRYPKGKLHEDEFLIHYILHLCNRCVYTSAKLYYYMQRKGSITDKVSWNAVEDGFDALIDRVNFLYKNGYEKMYISTKIQVLHYITKYYDKLSDENDATLLLVKLYDTFKEFYKCKDVQGNLDNEKIILYRYFVKTPKLYYRKLLQISKRKQLLDKIKMYIKNMKKW